ncbi:MAG: hypothetical protein KU37_09675 [Sulfuricurvum sp. PC08-66]|nr:MAG: hypothetical protein KU37_09675 [Sulfuricurvum sp. PC08-66]
MFKRPVILFLLLFALLFTTVHTLVHASHDHDHDESCTVYVLEELFVAHALPTPFELPTLFLGYLFFPFFVRFVSLTLTSSLPIRAPPFSF